MPDKLSRIKLLAMDIDGTLTDGGLLLIGGEQLKIFHVHDGLGIRLAIVYGLKIAWITGNISPSVTDRARALGVTDVYQGVKHKSGILKQVAVDHGLSLDEIAYMGDDINDLPAFEQAGYRIAVGNAWQDVKDRADMVTTRCGGQGAVREAIENIIRARGEWDEAVKAYLKELELEDERQRGPEAVA